MRVHQIWKRFGSPLIQVAFFIVLGFTKTYETCLQNAY